MTDLNAQIIESVLATCEEKRGSDDERYNCGYENALKRIRCEIREMQRDEEDRIFVLLNAHPERNLKVGGLDYVEECMKFMKKKFEIFEDELGNIQIIRIADDQRSFIDRELAAPEKIIENLNKHFCDGDRVT